MAVEQIKKNNQTDEKRDIDDKYRTAFPTEHAFSDCSGSGDGLFRLRHQLGEQGFWEP
jgi:hypothetical protein